MKMKQSDNSAPVGCAEGQLVTDWFGRNWGRAMPGGGKTSCPRAPGQALPHPALPGGERGHGPVAQPPAPRREAELSHGEAAGEVFISDRQRFNCLQPDKVPLIITPEGNRAFLAGGDGAKQPLTPVLVPAQNPPLSLSLSFGASRVVFTPKRCPGKARPPPNRHRNAAALDRQRPGRTCLGKDELQDEGSPGDDAGAAGKEISAGKEWANND